MSYLTQKIHLRISKFNRKHFDSIHFFNDVSKGIFGPRCNFWWNSTAVMMKLKNLKLSSICTTTNLTVIQIRDPLLNYNMDIIYCLINHNGIKGNETTDQLAREAINNRTLIVTPLTPKYV